MLNSLSSVRSFWYGLGNPRDERMELTTGGGWMALVGVGPLLMGLVGTYRAFAEGPDGGPSGSTLWGLAELAGSLVFLCAGLALVFGRRGHLLDRREWQVISWWGLLRPWTTRTRSLGEFDHVALDRRVVCKGKSTREVFPTELRGSGAALLLFRSPSYKSALRQAEAVAHFLELDLHDSTAGATFVREAGRLNESLRDQAVRLGEHAVFPEEVPVGSRIAYHTEGDSAVIDLPPSRLAAARRAAQIALLLVGGELVLFMLLPIIAPGVPRILLVLGLVSGVLAALVLARALMLGPIARLRVKGEHIIVSARELRVERSGLGGTAGVICADQIEELVLERRIEHPVLLQLGMTAGLVARSDRQTVCFATGLSSAERQWLRDAIRYIVIDPPHVGVKAEPPALCHSA